MSAIAITLPDGAVRELSAPTTGAAVAADISKSLAKKALACRIDGRLADLSEPIARDARLEIVTAADEAAALELIRHDCAHIMARAVQEIWPDTKVTIGPVIENGFFYDFDRKEPFTDADFEQIE
ncbi:MAG: TGS domain-containing protein, partial [Pseudomonadota bacterium]